jgi:hypothetical protein
MRSYVEPIINASVISQIDLRRDIARLVQLDFPERLLPTFLHEGTHHACFNSPVGTALALLRMRAYRRATRLRTHPDEDHWDLLEDVLRQEVTMELLRPLSEGMSCFSELDSVPGQSNVITMPMLSAFFNFGGSKHEFKKKEILDKHGPNAFLFSLLYRARTDPELSQRREAVLAGQFPLKFGGHLAGYMALKNIWAAAKKRSSLAWDAELFLSFLRSFFYDDYGLIAVMLDPNVSEHNAANAIATYITSRLKKLLTIDIEKSLTDHETHLGRTAAPKSGGHLVHILPGGLEMDKSLRDIGIERLEDLFSELIDSEAFDDVERMMRNFDLQRIQKREMMCLGSLDAEVEVNSFGRVLARALTEDSVAEMPTIAVAALDGTAIGKAPGALEFYLIPADNASASVVLRNNEIVFVNFDGPISKTRQQKLTSLFGARARDLEIIAEQEENLEHVINKDAIHFVRDQAKITAPQGIEKLYLWLATLSVSQENWQAASEVLQEGGLLKLCGGDVEFIIGLAFLGVAGSVCTDLAELIAMGKEQRVEVSEICRKAASIQSTVGLPTILEGDGKLMVIM